MFKKLWIFNQYILFNNKNWLRYTCMNLIFWVDFWVYFFPLKTSSLKLIELYIFLLMFVLASQKTLILCVFFQNRETRTLEHPFFKKPRNLDRLISCIQLFKKMFYYNWKPSLKSLLILVFKCSGWHMQYLKYCKTETVIGYCYGWHTRLIIKN